jgi:hypothetical protein
MRVLPRIGHKLLHQKNGRLRGRRKAIRSFNQRQDRIARYQPSTGHSDVTLQINFAFLRGAESTRRFETISSGPRRKQRHLNSQRPIETRSAPGEPIFLLRI